MLIAHLPAGCVFSKYLNKRIMSSNSFIWIGIFGSIFPDFDILYFYLIDSQHLHHTLLFHQPFFWVLVFIVSYFFAVLLASRVMKLSIIFFFINIFFHLILDSVTGGIMWLYPFSLNSFNLITIQATHNWWVYSFLFHWTFFFELFITVFAIVYFVKEIKCFKNWLEKMIQNQNI